MQKITGHLVVQSNTRLVSLQGLREFNVVGAYIDISGNPNLVSLSGLANLSTVHGAKLTKSGQFLVVFDNTMLSDSAGLLMLSCKTSVGDLGLCWLSRVRQPNGRAQADKSSRLPK